MASEPETGAEGAAAGGAASGEKDLSEKAAAKGTDSEIESAKAQ